MKNVIKRNGTIVPFNRQKIVDAITKASKEVNSGIDSFSVVTIAEYVQAMEQDMDVESIQNIVEDKLMESGHTDVARAYMNYRYLHGIARNEYKELMNAVAEKLSGKNIANQNANVDEASFGGRIGEMSRIVSKRYALDYCMSDMAKQNHLNNEIYIHDLDSYAVGMHNCLSVPFDDLLAKGFNTRQTDVRPAQSINTALQLVAVIFQVQSLQQFGGVSATHLDWTMVPYVRKSFFKHYLDGLKYICNTDEFAYKKTDAKNISIDDRTVYSDEKVYVFAKDMTTRELYQAVEGLYHNLNTLQSRSGNQLPFTSINYGTCTLSEGRMVIKALLDTSIKGIGALHRTSIFPCGIFQMMKGVNRKPGEPNYDLYQLALRSTAQRLYPNYANVDWTGNAGYDKNDVTTYFSTMGCRTANGWDINGLGQKKDGRGNIAPVTIILPTLAMEAHQAAQLKKVWPIDDSFVTECFMEILDKKLHEARDMLKERFEWICSQSPNAAKFMWENHTMAGYDGKSTRSALKHGTLAVGLLGMAETLQILIGTDQTSEQGMALAKRICQLYKDRCNEFKQEDKLNYGVYFTPAENLCFTAMQKFKDTYGTIPNISDKEFFTNSVHVPVWKEVNPFKKIDIESQLDCYSSAGCILYVELDSTVKHNLKALEEIVNYAMDKDVPYFAINVPNDTCMNCGYCDEIGNTCPQCGSDKIQRLRRVTGYLTGDYKTAFNRGKQQEVEMRIKHNRVGR